MPDENHYRLIAERRGFEIPAPYRQLRERGLLTLDRPGSQITAIPGDGYLYMHEMEWNSLEEIADFEFPEYYRPHLPNLTPFAFNGAGDYWCWQSEDQSHGERVLLCRHDDGIAEVFAPSFEAAVFRQTLAYAQCCAGSETTPFDEARAYLKRWATDLAPIWPRAWSQLLISLAEAPSVTWMEGSISVTSLLSHDQRREIEARELAFADLGEEIPWMMLK